MRNLIIYLMSLSELLLYYFTIIIIITQSKSERTVLRLASRRIITSTFLLNIQTLLRLTTIKFLRPIYALAPFQRSRFYTHQQTAYFTFLTYPIFC